MLLNVTFINQELLFVTMKDVIRLSNQTKATLKPFSENPNHAVSVMMSMIRGLERDIQGQNRIIEELQKALQSVTISNCKPQQEGFHKSSEPYVTKSNVPIKTFGKINPEEQLQEPIGRQGRDVR